jgi:hypothetical protein
MKKIVILIRRDDNFSRGEINYINRPIREASWAEYY